MARKDEPLGIILGGGQGTRLFPLTAVRSKPAVPLGGMYRLIDISVSNCINSGVTKIYVLTQFNSASLNRHISRTYRFSPFSDGFVEILAAEQTLENRNWFQGTADAVRQGWRHFDLWKSDTYLILAGDHLYRMDYSKFIERHRQTDADVTVSVVAVGVEGANEFGLVKIDEGGRIAEFREKPKGAALGEMQVDTTRVGLSREEAKHRPHLASMGIYVFKKNILKSLLREDESKVDFGKELIPSSIRKYNVRAYLFNDYWEDIGTIKSFYQANMDLTLEVPKFSLLDPESPIFTNLRFLPPATVTECRIKDCLLSDGCTIRGAELVHSIIGIRTRIAAGVQIGDTIIMGSDFYQTEDEIAADRQHGIPPLGIGENTIVRKAIIDKNARIGSNVKILNEAGVENLDRENYYVRDGIIIIPKNAIVPDGTVI